MPVGATHELCQRLCQILIVTVPRLIELGESVTWEARHLGVRQRLTSRVTAFDRPNYFRDEMTAGAFQSFAHDHRFEVRNGGTVMTDDVEFRSPFGPLGRLVDAVFMTGYLRRLLAGRCRAIKCEAEAIARTQVEHGGVCLWR